MSEVIMESVKLDQQSQNTQRKRYDPEFTQQK